MIVIDDFLMYDWYANNCIYIYIHTYVWMIFECVDARVCILYLHI